MQVYSQTKPCYSIGIIRRICHVWSYLCHVWQPVIITTFIMDNLKSINVYPHDKHVNAHVTIS